MRKAAAAVDDAVVRLESARGELREALVTADAAAWTLPTIAEAAGVTKQRMHQIVAQAREQDRAKTGNGGGGINQRG